MSLINTRTLTAHLRSLECGVSTTNCEDCDTLISGFWKWLAGSVLVRMTKDLVILWRIITSAINVWGVSWSRHAINSNQFASTARVVCRVFSSGLYSLVDNDANADNSLFIISSSSACNSYYQFLLVNYSCSQIIPHLETVFSSRGVESKTYYDYC